MTAVNADQPGGYQSAHGCGSRLAVKQSDFAEHGASSENGDTSLRRALTGEDFDATFFDDVRRVPWVTPLEDHFLSAKNNPVKSVCHGCAPVIRNAKLPEPTVAASNGFTINQASGACACSAHGVQCAATLLFAGACCLSGFCGGRSRREKVGIFFLVGRLFLRLGFVG